MADAKIRLLLFLSTALFGLSELDGIVNTIEDQEYGVLIDCVDIYKQPALRNPRLKNHTTQIKPISVSVHPRSEEEKLGMEPFNQSWSKYGECPQGTIPVLRKTQPEHNRAPPPKTQVLKHYNSNGSLDDVVFTSPPGHEFAQLAVVDGKYISAHAFLNVWTPNVVQDEGSTSLICIMSGIDLIVAGWMVDPTRKFRNRVTFTTYWGVYQRRHFRGCYDLECPGFVQVNRQIALGYPISPVSTYGGSQSEIGISLLKDQSNDNWWLRFHGVDVGYWPASLFTTIDEFAESITWGGNVKSVVKPGDSHTSTQMGSGHFPSEGFGKSCYFRDIWYATQVKMSTYPEEAGKYYKYATRPECYDARDAVEKAENGYWGVYLYFGGPGYSKQCKLTEK